MDSRPDFHVREENMSSSQIERLLEVNRLLRKALDNVNMLLANQRAWSNGEQNRQERVEKP
jgi:hypothetical protein